MKNNYKKSQQGGSSKAIPKLEQGMMSAIQIHSPLIVIMSTISITFITLRWLWGGIAMIVGGIFSLLLWWGIGKTRGSLTNDFGFASNPDLPSGMEGLIYLFPAFMVGYVPASAMEIIDEDNNASSGEVGARALFGGIFYISLFFFGLRYYKSFIRSSWVYFAMGASVIVGGAIGIMAHSMIGDELYDAFYFSRGDSQSGKCYIKEVSI